MFRSKKFPTFRSKHLWHSGQFFGIQTDVAFRPDFPMFRLKKFPTFRSMQLVAFRPIFRYSDRSGIQASLSVSRPILIISYLPMLRSKSFPVFRLMSGIQAMVISVLPFILVFRLIFFFRYSDQLSPYQTDSLFKTTSLPILTGIITSFLTSV